MLSGLRAPLRSSALRLCLSLAVTAGVFGAQSLQLRAQQAELRQAAPARIVGPIDEQSLKVLKNNVRKDATEAVDDGPVEDAREMHLYLVLQRTPAQQADLENLVQRQQQKGAAEYHQWLTPAQFGARFGVAPADIATLSQWLESHGLQVRSVLNNRSLIDFSATAGQVREAFHTQLHYLNLRGGRYPALVQDPQIPAALAPVVAGIKGLNKVPAYTNHTAPRQAQFDEATHRWHNAQPSSDATVTPAYNAGGGDYDVAPKDFYTIYNVNPLLTAGHLAANATVAVIEESDIEYGTVNATTHAAAGGDVATVRSLFGVPGTLNMHVYHGYGSVTCSDPGIDPSHDQEDVEASLDAEWINVTAPSANEIFMSCDDTTDNGIFSSMAALVDNNLADSMSLSYGETEIDYSSSDYASQDTLYAQAATQGQSIFISSGDSGSDVADQNTPLTATHGLNVSAFGSPMVTVTGGTDFQDLYDAQKGGKAQSTYWSATNSSSYSDALSYVPEMTWNDSCASSILAAENGDTGAGYCATGADTIGDVVGGSGGISTHYAVPSWQTGISGYSNSMHAQPDIAGFAASGTNSGHGLLFCDSNPTLGGGYACTSSSLFGVAGGTSFVAPYMAGVGGMLVSYTSARQGLLNPALYALGKTQYTATDTKTACYATGQTSNTGVTTSLPNSACIFNDVTTGNNDVPCAVGAPGCYVNSGEAFGMLSSSGSGSLTVAYPATVGFDQATGIGSVNVDQLVTKWSQAFSTSIVLTATPATLDASQSTVLQATITANPPTGHEGAAPPVTGTVAFAYDGRSLADCTVTTGTCSITEPATAFYNGANQVTATYSGNATYPGSTSSQITVTVSGTTGAETDPYQIQFPSTSVGTTATLDGIITNDGPNPMKLTSISILGNNVANFKQTNTCVGETIAVGSACVVQVMFTPDSVDSFQASMYLYGNLELGPAKIDLSGTGTTGEPAVKLSPTSIAFPTIAPGTTSTMPITVTNTGTATLYVTAISNTGANPTLFTHTSKCGGVAVTPGSSCTIQVSFAPTASGPFTATLNIFDNVTGSPQTVTLSGSGGAAPAVTFSPAALVFPGTNPGATATLPVTVTNSGGASLTVSSIAFTGGDSGAFSHTSNCGGIAIAPGAHCTVQVTFTPSTFVQYESSMQITDNVTGSPQTVSVTGYGGDVTVSPSFIQFQATAIGASTTTPVTLTNVGTAPLTVSSISNSGTNTADFTHTSNCGGRQIPYQGTCTIQVTFTPQAPGNRLAYMSIYDNADGSPQMVTLVGFGGDVALSNYSLAFPATNVGSTATMPVQLTNYSSGPLTVSSISNSGANPTDFSHTSNCGGQQILVDGSCTIEVTFTPAASGSFSATLNIYDNVTDSPQKVTLTGTGTAAPSQSVTVSATPASIKSSESTVLKATLIDEEASGQPAAAAERTGTVIFKSGANSLGSCTLTAGACSLTVPGTSLESGTNSVKAIYAPARVAAPSESRATMVTVDSGSPVVSLTVGTMVFGNWAVGSISSSLSATMTNTGTATLDITSIALGGANPTQYVFANSCGATLAAGANCTIHGHFAPTVIGSLPASVIITDNASNSPQSISLTGSGTGPFVSLSATNLAYGNEAVGNLSGSQSVTMTNTGTVNLGIDSISLGGANPSQYGFANDCNSNLAPGASCTIHGHLAPTSTGSKPASVVITDSASNSPQTISLSGTGVTAPAAVSLSATSLDFGSESDGLTTASQQVTLTNTGSATLTFSSIVLTGANTSQYDFANSCGTSLAGGHFCYIHGHFSPTQTGSLPASIVITDNASDSPQTIAISGTGLAPGPQVSLQQTSIAFPNTAVGDSSPEYDQELTNTGTSTLVISSITIGGTTPVVFALDDQCSGRSLAPGYNCMFGASFHPTRTGSFTGSLIINDNAANSPQTVSLSGTGIPAPGLSGSPSAVQFK
jgi:hypothetical protein